LAGVGIVQAHVQGIIAGRPFDRQGKSYGLGHEFAGLPEGGRIKAMVRDRVILGIHLTVGADELDEANEVGRGREGLPVEHDGDWRLEIGDLGSGIWDLGWEIRGREWGM